MAPAGRPTSPNPKDIRFSIRLDFETDERLSEYCVINDIKKSVAIRKAIELLLKHNEEENNVKKNQES